MGPSQQEHMLIAQVLSSIRCSDMGTRPPMCYSRRRLLAVPVVQPYAGWYAGRVGGGVVTALGMVAAQQAMLSLASYEGG